MKADTLIKSIVIVLCFCLMLSGCGGDGDSAKGAARAVPFDSFSIRQGGLEGLDRTLVVLSDHGAGTNYTADMKFYSQDSQNPDLLIDQGTVDLGIPSNYGYNLPHLTVSQDWAVGTIFGGYVTGVSLANAPNYTQDFLIQITGATKACAVGNWLLVTSGSDIALVDISDPANPLLDQTIVAASQVSGLAAATDKFFVFTENGYLFVDLSNPANIVTTEITDLDLGKAEKIYPYGNFLYIGGPSKFAGKSKIAKIDITTPTTPVIDVIEDQINGNFFDFAYDGGSNCYLQLDGTTISKYLLSPTDISFVWLAGLTSYGFEVSKLYAFNNRFYFADAAFGLGIFSGH